MIYYCQCVLRKPVENGSVTEVSWIPEKFAIKGEVLKLKEPDGSWDNGWVVESVGAKESKDHVLEGERAWKRQRKASDLPQGVFKHD